MQPLFANADVVFADIVARMRADTKAEAVILSLEETSSLDSTTLDGLIECDQRLAALGETYLARVKQSVVTTLAAAGADDLVQRATQNFSVSDAWKAASAMLAEKDARS